MLLFSVAHSYLLTDMEYCNTTLEELKLYTLMQHLIKSQNMNLAVFRLLFCKQIFKRNANHCYFNFFLLKFPATKYSLVLKCCHAWGLLRITNSSDHKKVCTANLVHAVQLPKPLCRKLYGSMGYASALHVQNLQLKPLCRRWNLLSLVNLQYLSKSPDETEVLHTKLFSSYEISENLLEIRGKPWNNFPWNSITINAALGHSKPIYIMIITVTYYIK